MSKCVWVALRGLGLDEQCVLGVFMTEVVARHAALEVGGWAGAVEISGPSGPAAYLPLAVDLLVDTGATHWADVVRAAACPDTGVFVAPARLVHGPMLVQTWFVQGDRLLGVPELAQPLASRPVEVR